jgi:hypothetical protein
MLDLVDVLHFMFEEDMVPASAEQQEARGKLRERIYTEWYGRDSYGWLPREGADGATTLVGSDTARTARRAPAEASPREGEPMRHYGYIPPTPFDPEAEKPFGDILDAPLG